MSPPFHENLLLFPPFAEKLVDIPEDRSGGFGAFGRIALSVLGGPQAELPGFPTPHARLLKEAVISAGWWLEMSWDSRVWYIGSNIYNFTYLFIPCFSRKCK